jgi:hypothetical protein
LVALAFWVGGLAVLAAVAAPTLFAILQAHDAAGGRALAGLAFGAIFRRFQYGAWAAALLLLMSIGFRAALGPRPRRFGLRMWIVAAMLAGSLASEFVIAPRITALDDAAGGAVSKLSPSDPRRVTFGRWHGASSAVMLVTLLAGLGLFWAEVDDDREA